jgi:hypothetical protein
MSASFLASVFDTGQNRRNPLQQQGSAPFDPVSSLPGCVGNLAFQTQREATQKTDARFSRTNGKICCLSSISSRFPVGRCVKSLHNPLFDA